MLLRDKSLCKSAEEEEEEWLGMNEQNSPFYLPLSRKRGYRFTWDASKIAALPSSGSKTIPDDDDGVFPVTFDLQHFFHA